MTILDNINRVTPEELAAGVYQLLYAGTADFETQEKMRDLRLVPILNTILQANGRPPFAPYPDLPKDRTDRVMMSAAYLLADIAGPEDRETIQTLIDLLDYENDRVKMAAATALGQIGAAEATAKVVEFTERMIAQGDIGAVAKLSRVLARIGSEEAKASLETFIAQNKDAADKHMQHVVAEAQTAIRSINERLA